MRDTRTINEINVHCAATRPDWMARNTGAEQAAEIRRWHVSVNGWSDIGYHFIIDRAGHVHTGRPLDKPGAFEPKVNRTAVGVCLIGGFGSQADGEFGDHYTPAQNQALRTLIIQLRAQYPSITKVSGHNEYSSKACPGFNVRRWLENKPPRQFVESRTAIGAALGLVGASAATAIPATFDAAALLAQVEAAQGLIEPLATTVPALRWVAVALTFAGPALALWARWQDWQKGRR
jgi:N-acetylmuramoyl-L-alanine amidase